uniref:Transmembrane protein n=1 Tax=Steinernema glaseri TaxID=37863 RepID=A0A1I7YWW1_9BILA
MAFFVLIGLSALLWSVAFYLACYIGFRRFFWRNDPEEQKAPGRKALHMLKMIAFMKIVFSAVATVSSWNRSTVSCQIDSTIYISQEKCLTQLRSEYPAQLILVSFLLIPAVHAFLGVLCFDVTNKTVLNDEGRAWPVLSVLSLAETIASLLTFFLTGFVYNFCVDFWQGMGEDCVPEQLPWMLAIYSSYMAAFCGAVITILMGFITYFVPGQKAIEECEAIAEEAEMAVSAACDGSEDEWLPFEISFLDEEVMTIRNYNPFMWIDFNLSASPSELCTAHPARFSLVPRTDTSVMLIKSSSRLPDPVLVKVQFTVRHLDPHCPEGTALEEPKPQEVLFKNSEILVIDHHRQASNPDVSHRKQ